MRRAFLLLAVVATAVLAMGCASKGVVVTRPAVPAAEQAGQAKASLAAAESAYQQGRLQEADRLFTDFLRRHPNQPGQDLAWLRHSQVQLKLGFPQGARQGLEYVVGLKPPSPHATEARLALAQTLVDLGQPQPALYQLAQLQPAALQGPDLTAYHHQTARARFRLDEPKSALVALVTAAQSASPRQAQELEATLAQFVSAWPESTVQTLSGLYRSAFPTAWLISGLADKAARRGDLGAAQRYKDDLATRFPSTVLFRTPPVTPQPGSSTPTPSGPAPSPEPSSPPVAETKWTLGCLLPLSGPLADYGQRALNGIQLALEAHQETSPFALNIQDTADDPLVTSGGVDKLAENQDLLAVIGPLSLQLAGPATERASQLGLPLLLLTQSLPSQGGSGWIFRDFFTPSALIEALAEHAVKKLELARASVLRPDNAYGRRMADLFTQAWTAQGGTIVRQVSYLPGTPDLGRQMLALGGLQPQSPPKEREVPLDYQALFIPDDARSLAQVAPQLAFYDLTGLTLLGTNLWHDLALLELAGPYVQGALIPSVFFADSEAAHVRDFVSRYQAAYGHPPDLFAAAGYDAAKLVAEVCQSGKIKTRADLRQALLQVKDFPGLTGLTSFTPQGEAAKKPYLITVKGQAFKPAPEIPTAPPTAGKVIP